MNTAVAMCAAGVVVFLVSIPALKREMAKTSMAAKKTIKIEQTGSPIRRHHSQRSTLIGLKLNKIGRVAELPDTPAVRGMIEKVHHLVRVVDGK